MVKLPWIPAESEWLRLLEVFRPEPIRNRLMLALAYDAALRREELCSLRTDDVDPAHRTLRVRAETTKTRRERVVPYSASTGVLLADYLRHRGTLSRARGPLFLSESRRNRGEPLTLWTWSKVVRRVALAADVPRFSTHTTRHLCLTDLARMGWELHAIASFAGHYAGDLVKWIMSGCVLVESGEQSVEDLLAAELSFVDGVVALGLAGWGGTRWWSGRRCRTRRSTRSGSPARPVGRSSRCRACGGASRRAAWRISEPSASAGSSFGAS